MATGYYLQDNPNKVFGQYGWPRTKVSGVIGVHTTESGVVFSGPDAGAENTASWMTRRVDPGSYHAMADADSRIKLVHPRYAAWADTTNNAHAMSVSAAMNAARWRDLSAERAASIVRNLAYAAAELVQDALAAGLLTTAVPARRITAQEAISGSRAGFYGHGETNPGRRYDPGTNFDWTLFLQTYASAMGGGLAAQGTTTNPEEYEVVSDDDIKRIARATADLLWPSISIQNDQFHTATRNNIIQEVAAKIEDGDYKVKQFVQAVDNENTDRAILDNRAEEEATRLAMEEGK